MSCLQSGNSFGNHGPPIEFYRANTKLSVLARRIFLWVHGLLSGNFSLKILCSTPKLAVAFYCVEGLIRKLEDLNTRCMGSLAGGGVT